MKPICVWKIPLIVILAMALLTSCAQITPESPVARPEGLEMRSASEQAQCVATFGTLSLWYKEQGAELMLQDSGESFPGTYTKEKLDFEGTAALKIQSQLLIRYANENNSISETTSIVSSVNRKTYTIQRLPNGVKFIFDFSREKEQFVIPVEYTLENGALRVKICTDEIVEYGKNRLVSIALLPGLMSGFPDEEGTIVLPDGIGAEVDFTVKSSGAPSISMDVYGRDPALTTSRRTAVQQVCRLPVFGTAKDEGGILAVIEDGASLASIQCDPATKENPVTCAYAEFRYRALDAVTLADQSFKAKEVSMLSTCKADTPFTVRYVVKRGKTNFADLAFLYRDYLLSHQKKEQKTAASVYLQAFGSVKAKDSFLGVVYHHDIAVTTFEQMTEIARLVQAETEKATFLLQGFGKNGYGATTQSLTTVGASGGEKGLQKFQESLSENSAVYFGTQAMLDTKVRLQGQYAGNVFSEAIYENRFLRSLGTPVTAMQRPYFKHSVVENTIQKLIIDVADSTYDGIYFNDIGSIVFSDFHRNHSQSREQAVASQQNLLQEYREKFGNLIVSGGNAYALPYASVVTNVPLTSSRYLISSGEIPFVPLALSGVVQAVSVPIGAQDTDVFIKACALGMGIQFSLTGVDNFALKETALSFLNGTEFFRLKDHILEYTRQFQSITDIVKDSRITGFVQPESGIYEVVYDNGVKLIANTSGGTFQYGEVSVPPNRVVQVNQ